MKIKGQTQVAEMKVLRKIIGKTRTDRISNENIRQMCNIQNIADWITRRRHEWNEHITRMDPQRLNKHEITTQEPEEASEDLKKDGRTTCE
jgi:hypothetical protein